MDILPVAVFAFNRPDKLKRILEALRAQIPDRLLVFVDGPRNAADQEKVEACRELARRVDWVGTELILRAENQGLPGLTENIRLALERHPWAVFVEDDCLPMPGFYAYMRRALETYRDQSQIFSIGAYQYLPPEYFHESKWGLVGCPRFTCWGWGTWRERWQAAQPLVDDYRNLFDGLRKVPQIAGEDLPQAARVMADGRAIESWDIKVALAALASRQIHLLPARGLVRNIGLERSGVHRGLASALRSQRLQNRNVTETLPPDLFWPESPALDCDYAAALRSFVEQTRGRSPRALMKRARTLARRYLWPVPERFFDLDLREESEKSAVQPAGNSLTVGAKSKKWALLAYIVHPFSIPPDDPRFLRHINIWHARELVRVLNRMGYRVDVIDYRDRGFKPRQLYDLFIGHGGVNFASVASRLSPQARKLYFSTGAYWKYHNEQESARFTALQQRRGGNLPPDRQIGGDEEAALGLADGILGIGNDFTRQTYAVFSNVTMINGCSLYDAMFDWCPKDYVAGRQNFVFFSGGGNVHKGLDLLLEAFTGLPQQLWIGSRLDPDFARLYARELHRTPNIHTLGWLQPRSAQFYKIMRACNFCLLPSCSEGQSQAVLECMNQGVIPVVSQQAGVYVDDLGVWIESCTVEDIRSQVQELSALTPQRCAELSARAREAVLSEYSEERFSRNLQATLEALIPDSVAGGEV